MLPDRVSNPRPLTYESGTLPIALCGPASPSNLISHTYSPLEVKLLHWLNIFLFSYLLPFKGNFAV